MDEKKALKERITRAREHAGLNKSALARALGVDSSAAIQWEKDDNGLPKLENLIQIARVTGVYFEWLATGRGRMTSSHHNQVNEAACAYISKDDEELLRLFRGLPVSKRAAIMSFIQAMSGKK